MDKTIKALIIVVIILVAVLGVAAGFILQSYMSNSNKNIVVNQTNSSINNTPNQTNANASISTNSGTKTVTNPVNNNNGYISTSDAENIAIQYAQNYEDPQGLPVTINTNSNGYIDQHIGRT